MAASRFLACRLKSSLATCIAGLTGLLGPLAGVAMAGTVDCASLSLSVDSLGLQATCETGNDSGRGFSGDGRKWVVSYERLRAQSGDTFLYVEGLRAGIYTQLPSWSVWEIVMIEPVLIGRDKIFLIPEPATASEQRGDFQLEQFKGTREGESGYWNCRGFVRYAAPINGGFFRQRVFGALCRSGDAVPEPAELAQLLDSIRFE